jgi:peptidoglycan/LPS O-acetylase OafA/YrhL
MLVIYIHVSSVPVTQLLKDSWQFAVIVIPWRLSAFVVPGFIFLSGLKLFLNKSQHIAYGNFYLRRLTAIVIPYIIWVVIYYLYFVYNNYFDFSIADLLRYIVVGDLVSHFYFVIIIIQFYALAPVWMRWIKRENPCIALIVSLLVTIILGQSLPSIIAAFIPDYSFLYTDRVFTTYLIYWVGGCFAGLYYEQFKEMIRQRSVTMVILYAVAASADAALYYLGARGIVTAYYLENIHVLYCICAVLFFFLIFMRMSEKGFLQSSFISTLDRSTYQIYLSHCLVIFIVNGELSRFGIGSVSLSYLVRVIVTYGVTIACCMFWNKVKGVLSSVKANHRL